MEKKNNETVLPEKHNSESSIFDYCMSHFTKFMNYLIRSDEKMTNASEKFPTPDFRNLYLDSSRLLENGDAINDGTPHIPQL